MAQVEFQSPYTTPIQLEESPEYPNPESVEFAAPPLEGENGWVDLPGLGYASPHRTPVGLLFDYRPEESSDPGRWWDSNNDVKERHSVEDQDTDGFEKTSEGSGKPTAVHPESIRSPEPRLTGLMSPHTYHFTRPFDQHAERLFNGLHFSMADHRRDYDIGGHAPVRSARNTYRIEPSPYDVDIVDVPPDYEPTQLQARIQAVDILPSGDRAYRLM